MRKREKTDSHSPTCLVTQSGWTNFTWWQTSFLHQSYRCITEKRTRGNTPLSEGTIVNHGWAILNLTTWLRDKYCFDDEVCHGLEKVLTRMHPLVNNMNKAQKFNVMMSKEEVYDFIQSNWVAEQRQASCHPDAIIINGAKTNCMMLLHT